MTLAGRVAGAVAPFHFFIFFLLSHTTRQGGPPYISRALLAPTTSVSLQLPTVFPRNLLASPLHTPIVRRRPLPSWLARSASVSVGGGVSGLSVHPLKWSLGSIYLCLTFSFLPPAGLTGPRDRLIASSQLPGQRTAGGQQFPSCRVFIYARAAGLLASACIGGGGGGVFVRSIIPISFVAIACMYGSDQPPSAHPKNPLVAIGRPPVPPPVPTTSSSIAS